jgi:signal transduction histidine kinase
VTFRARLLLASVTTLAVGLGVLLVAGNILLSFGVHAQESSLLRARAEAQVAALTVTGGHVRVRETPNDALLDKEAWVLEGSRVVERPSGASPALDRLAIALGRRGGTAERDGPGELRLRTQPVRGAGGGPPAATVVVARSVASTERLQQEVLIGSLVMAALVLLAGALAIHNAIGGALRPVARMTADAEDWSEHDLDHRFGLGPPRDELTGLAATLDRLLGRIAASRRHDQRFASEVAHELRTPVAGLRGRAELALDARGPEAGGERIRALQAVVSQADRLDATIETLLAMARQEHAPGTEAVDLAALAREFEGVDVHAPPGMPPGEGEPELIRRALAPLVENARRHSRERVVLELSSEDGRVRVAVRDDGPGLDPSLAERVFEPGVGTNGDGAGLGLPLARRLARTCGGDVSAGDGPGGCFVLELPAIRA